MKIVLVTQNLGPGGSERVVSELSRYFSTNNHQVTLVTFEGQSADFYSINDSVERICLPEGQYYGFFKRNFLRVIGLREVIKDKSPDICISFLEHVNVISCISCIGVSTKVNIAVRNDPRRKKISFPFQILRRLIYPFADRLIVQTESLKKWIDLKGWNQNVVVIPNAVVASSSIPDRSFDREKVSLMSVGRLVEQKGFDLLLEALASLPSSSQYHLDIFGEGEMRPRIESLIRAYDLESKVSLKGITDDIYKEYQNHDIFILPSRYEGFPNVLIEAMSQGMACVSFDCPSGPADILTHGKDGILVKDLDVKGLALEIENLMDDRKLREKYSRNALSIVERYNEEKVLPLWLEEKGK